MASIIIPAIHKLGGRPETVRLLNDLETKLYGQARTTYARVRAWENADTGCIPGDAVRLIMRIMEQRNIAYSSTDFFPRASRARRRGRPPVNNPQATEKA